VFLKILNGFAFVKLQVFNYWEVNLLRSKILKFQERRDYNLFTTNV